MACPALTLGSKKCEHKVAFPLSCPIKIAICPSPCSTIWKAVCLDDNVEMTDRSIQGGFSAVCLPRAINRRGRPKEREEREGGSSWEWKRREGERSDNERRWARVRDAVEDKSTHITALYWKRYTPEHKFIKNKSSKISRFSSFCCPLSVIYHPSLPSLLSSLNKSYWILHCTQSSFKACIH